MISIIVTFHNEEQSIISCLQSIVAQTAQQWECVVVDNASTDQGEFQVRNYLIDRRMRFMHLDEKVPVSIARRKGLEKTQGEWVMFVDGGDYLESNALQALYLTLKKYGTEAAIGNYYVIRDGAKRPVTYMNNRLIKSPGITESGIDVVTGNSIFSRRVATKPDKWPLLDYGYTEHIILVSGGQETALVKSVHKSVWKKILGWLKKI